MNFYISSLVNPSSELVRREQDLSESPVHLEVYYGTNNRELRACEFTSNLTNREV